MKLKVSKPTAFRLGEKKTTVLPHQSISIPDGLGKVLIRKNPGLIKRVR
ncbi:MAG: hypothetical protein KF751_06190 [Nitrospira sp.]|nr:hypothetical protein [Nitrospira sp.]